MVPLLMTLNPDFKVMAFFEVNCRKNDVSDKVTVPQEETMPNIWNATVW